MAAEIINLNKVRKARLRADKERKAEENRARHGRSRAERDADDAQRMRDKAHLDGSRRDAGSGGRNGETEEDLDPGSVS